MYNIQVENSFTFESELWVYPSEKSAWYFVTLPLNIAKKIEIEFGYLKVGFSSIPVIVKIGNSTWHTSLFKDNKRNSYLLPIKSQIRKKENLSAKQILAINIAVVT